MIKQITATSNPDIKLIKKLQLKKRTRDQTGLFLIEGYRENSRALEAGVKIVKTLICKEWWLKDGNEALLKKMSESGTQIIELPSKLFKDLSYRDRPDGFLSVAEQFSLTPKKLESPSEEPLYLVVESIEKPGNLGTLLRGCDAVGVNGLIIVSPVTDVFNPNVVRASTGALFSVPIIQFLDSQSAIDWLQNQGAQIFATTPSAKKLIYDIDFKKITSPIAIVAGAEQYGLSDFWLNADTDNFISKVKLPMNGSADSLNIAVSSIVCLYEVLRQRSNPS